MFNALLKSLSLLVVTVIGVTTAPHIAQAQPSYLQQMYLFSQLVPEIERIGVIRAADTISDEENERIQRAVASTGASLFVADIDDRRDVGPALREMTRSHDVQGIWIVQNDDAVGHDASRQYLIENATRAGVPLLAPDASWVEEGAPVTVVDHGNDVGLMVNEAVLQALSLNIPDEVSENIQYASN